MGPYAVPSVDKDSNFVSRVEAVLNSEQIQWPSKKLWKNQDKRADWENFCFKFFLPGFPDQAA